MWENCRWDVSACPPCSGELSWYALAVTAGLIETAPEAPVPQEEEMADEGEDASQDAVVETEESEKPAEM